MKDYLSALSGGDLRSIGKSNTVVRTIKTQKDFDSLFKLLFHKDRKVVMRAADAIEKISAPNPQFLFKYKSQLLQLLNDADNKELKWHLAQIIPRLPLKDPEIQKTLETLSDWLFNEAESKIVRVNSLQAIADLSANDPELRKKFLKMISHHSLTAPSLQARLKKIITKSPN